MADLFSDPTTKDQLQPQSGGISAADLLMFTVKSIVTTKPLPWLFELVNVNRQIMLQAESEEQKVTWVEALNAAVLHVYNTGLGKGTREGHEGNEATLEGSSSAKDALCAASAANAVCSDCGEANPIWVSLNFGSVICAACSGVHRHVGAHVTKVRSLTMDSWTESLIEMLSSLGNEFASTVLEARLHEHSDDVQRPTSASDAAAREEFIRDKYERKAFVAALKPAEIADASRLDPAGDLGEATLVAAAAAGDVCAVARLTFAMLEMTERMTLPSKKILAAAAAAAASSERLVALEFLMLNGAEIEGPLFAAAEAESPACLQHLLSVVDSRQIFAARAHSQDRRTPRTVAEQAGSTKCAELLAAAEDAEIARQLEEQARMQEDLQRQEQEEQEAMAAAKAKQEKTLGGKIAKMRRRSVETVMRD